MARPVGVVADEASPRIERAMDEFLPEAEEVAASAELVDWRHERVAPACFMAAVAELRRVGSVLAEVHRWREPRPFLGPAAARSRSRHVKGWHSVEEEGQDSVAPGPCTREEQGRRGTKGGRPAAPAHLPARPGFSAPQEPDGGGGACPSGFLSSGLAAGGGGSFSSSFFFLSSICLRSSASVGYFIPFACP